MSVRELYAYRRAAKTQIEEQAQPITMPQNPPQTDSTESKGKRGGRRPRAGRKPNLAKRLLSGVKPLTAAEALEGIDVRVIVHDLLKNGSRPVKLQTLTVLWDRIYGKPKQETNVTGGLLHTHTRDPRLAALSQEALEELARKYDPVLQSSPELEFITIRLKRPIIGRSQCCGDCLR